MSSAPLPKPQHAAMDDFHERLLASSTVPRVVPSRTLQIRRRGTLQQGRALESLGHAVEYLMDSAMFDPARSLDANQAAIQTLMRCSRAVFEECAEVLPLRRRLGRWGHDLVARALRQRPQSVSPPC